MILYCIILYYIILYIFYRTICCIYKYLVQHVETSRAIQGHPQNVTPVVLQGKKTRQDTPGMCKLPVAFWKKNPPEILSKRRENLQECAGNPPYFILCLVFVPCFCSIVLPLPPVFHDVHVISPIDFTHQKTLSR